MGRIFFWLWAALGVGAACGPDRDVLIGVAYTADSTYVPVARVLLDSPPPAGGPRIRFTGNVGGAELASTGLPGEVDYALRLVRQGIVAAVGPSSSRSALATASVYRDAGIPVVVPTATSRRLATLAPWLFVLAPNDSAEGAFIARFAARRLGARTATIFYNNDEYGVGLNDGVTAALAREGITALATLTVQQDRICGRPGQPNPFAQYVAGAAQRGRPDVVVTAGRGWETGCLVRLVHARWPSVPIIAGDGTVPDSQLARALPGSTADLYLVAFWHPNVANPQSQAFVRAFQRLTGHTPTHGDAFAHDAALLLVAAVRAAGPRPAAVRRYLEELGTGRPPYEGVTGPIAFTAGHPRPLLMTRYRGGRAELVQFP